MNKEHEKPAISKAIPVKGSILTVIPKPFLEELRIRPDSYLEHRLVDGAMVTRVLDLRVGKDKSGT